ncbi:hypothetical protein [Glaciihabitans sp. GrIS 2.15]|uniref:hypothetical protein n=1 Tax=Glaciihabitans sp. GrIS 2.15 TaxID=3071710 RepID=UPI002DFE78B7|nr:hypothetical protein [Glaciihabitans sp. GrIS 2.15]
MPATAFAQRSADVGGGCLLRRAACPGQPAAVSSGFLLAASASALNIITTRLPP